MIMTLVSVLGSFSLMYLVWRAVEQSKVNDIKISDFVRNHGKRSPDWILTQDISSRSKEAILAMDFLVNEASGLFQFVEVMLEDIGRLVNDSRERTGTMPDDLRDRLNDSFNDFRNKSYALGADFGIVESERAAKIAAFEKSSGDFYDALEELDAWSEQLLKDDAEKIEEMRNDIQVGRNTSLFTIGTACLVFLGICLFVSFLIHKSFLMPIQRMASAAKEAISERKSFTRSSFTKTPWSGKSINSEKKSLLRRESGPEEIETLSRTLWELVNNLEESVRVRTKELAERSHKLQQEMQNRKKLEADLQHAQKMETVGQMASGIAHEIRTPVQFAGDHLDFLKEFVNEIVENGVYDKLEINDAEFVTEMVPVALSNTQKGLDQISEIITSMKRFAYKDTSSAPTHSDINVAVKDCISLSRNEWKNVAELDSSLDPDLPLVQCRTSEITRVILNLIINAAQAIKAQEMKDLGEISVETKREDEHLVRVSVRDNGGGIPPEVASRIFEPFFTTKKVGVGTGQGLAISYNLVVERHHGKIYFDSEPGKGTTFHVLLPIDYSAPEESGMASESDGKRKLSL